MKLDIGGGYEKRGEDYVGVDITGNPDVKANMWDLPFQADSVQSIWSSHTLEHCPRKKVTGTLKEWLRVLRPGGRLICTVPNFDYVAKYWLTGENREWAEAMVFGFQDNDGDYHRTAFTHGLLRGDLEAAGFDVKRVELRWTHNQETLQAVAIKPEAR